MRIEEIRVCGIVQGVGFRPTVYRLAKVFGLNSLSEAPSVVYVTHYLRYEFLLNSISDVYIFNSLFPIELRFLRRGMLIPILQNVDSCMSTNAIAVY